MATPISIQLFSLRDQASQDLEGTLAKIAEYGYDGVEPYTFWDYKPAEFKAICDKFGLKITSFHTGLENYLNDGIEKTCADRIEAGCEVVAFPYLPGGYHAGQENYEVTKEYCAKIIEIYQKEGIELLSHNHEGDAYPCAEEPRGHMQALFADTGVNPEADTAWLLAAGINPVEFMNEYKGRVRAIHIKDFGYYGKIPSRICKAAGKFDAWNDNCDTFNGVNFEFRTLGQGIHDIAATVKAAVEVGGCKHVIVEQDNPTPGKDVFLCAKQNIEFLRTFEF